MKPAVVLFFALLLTWMQSGRLVEFVLTQKQHRRAVKKEIHAKCTDYQKTTFLFSQDEYAQLIWIDRHEFVVNNKMFDLVLKSKTTNGYRLVGIEDTIEKELIRKFAEENSDNNPYGKSVWKNVNIQYLTAQITDMNLPVLELEIQFLPDYSNFYNFLFADYVNHPPDSFPA